MRLELKRTGWEFIGSSYAESECNDRLEQAIRKVGYRVGKIVYYADGISSEYTELYCCGEYYYEIYKDNDYYETVTKIYKLDANEAYKIQLDKNFEFEYGKDENKIEEKVEENFVEKIKNCFSNFKNSVKKFQKKLSSNIKCFINDTKHYAQNFVEKSANLIKKCN